LTSFGDFIVIANCLVVSDAEEVIDDLHEINEECFEQDSSFNLTQDGSFPQSNKIEPS